MHLKFSFRYNLGQKIEILGQISRKGFDEAIEEAKVPKIYHIQPGK